MTLRLLLMRHGKSDWSADYARDHDRPLAERGIRAAKLMGELLANAGQLPEQIVASTAMRAKNTARLFVEGARVPIPIELSDCFYESTPQSVLAAIHRVPVSEPLMVVGHEPTWSDLTSDLMGGGELSFPTAAIARVDFECDRWSEVRRRQGTLKWLLQPKLFDR